MMRESAIAVGSIEVVGVDHREGLMNGIGCHQNGVCCAPWLRATRLQNVAGHELSNFLKDILDRDTSFIARSNHFFKRLFDFLADDEYDSVETGTASVINRVVHERLAVWSDGINLLQTAIAAAHARGQNEKCE